MSTHNIHFRREKKKYYVDTPFYLCIGLPFRKFVQPFLRIGADMNNTLHGQDVIFWYAPAVNL